LRGRPRDRRGHSNTQKQLRPLLLSRRITRGRGDWLVLPRATLSFATLLRLVPARPDTFASLVSCDKSSILARNQLPCQSPKVDFNRRHSRPSPAREISANPQTPGARGSHVTPATRLVRLRSPPKTDAPHSLCRIGRRQLVDAASGVRAMNCTCERRPVLSWIGPDRVSIDLDQFAHRSRTRTVTTAKVSHARLR